MLPVASSLPDCLINALTRENEGLAYREPDPDETADLNSEIEKAALITGRQSMVTGSFVASLEQLLPHYDSPWLDYKTSKERIKLRDYFRGSCFEIYVRYDDITVSFGKRESSRSFNPYARTRINFEIIDSEGGDFGFLASNIQSYNDGNKKLDPKTRVFFDRKIGTYIALDVLKAVTYKDIYIVNPTSILRKKLIKQGFFLI